MQCADIFQLNVDILQLGLDQKKCNMLAREYAGKINIPKPVSVANQMLIGLKGAKAGKISKSIPDFSVLMEDSPEDVSRKFANPYYDDEIEGNPIYEYSRYILIRWLKHLKLKVNNILILKILKMTLNLLIKKILKKLLTNMLFKFLTLKTTFC